MELSGPRIEIALNATDFPDSLTVKGECATFINNRSVAGFWGEEKKGASKWPRWEGGRSHFPGKSL